MSDDKKVATLDLLKKKTPVRREVQVVVEDDSGESQEVTLVFQSIGSKQYDSLMAKYPPNKKQQDEGLQYDIDKFAPALIAACCVEPEMTLDDAKEIWESDVWNRGELFSLFLTAVAVNTQGHDLRPTKSD